MKGYITYAILTGDACCRQRGFWRLDHRRIKKKRYKFYERKRMWPYATLVNNPFIFERIF